VATGGESIPRLYTRTGDRGTTGLAHGGRVDKDSPRIRAYGTFDELGAHLGQVEAGLPPALTELHQLVRRLEHELFVAQSELAVGPGGRPPAHRIEARHVQGLEREIDRWDAAHPELTTFVLAGGSSSAAGLHVARTVARRAERELWALHRIEPQRPELLEWTNRLSDLLFAVALAANHALGVAEVAPDYSV
jgi:cob(I)alamin adenosyltransferase